MPILCQCGCNRPVPIAKKTNRRMGWVKGQPKHFISGHNRTTHGATRNGPTPEYRAFTGAKYRCTNPHIPAWKHYGGRGIEFRYESFEQFMLDPGPRPAGKQPSGHPLYSLDRKDVNGHYEPGQCRWTTQLEQIHNRRPREEVSKCFSAAHD